MTPEADPADTNRTQRSEQAAPGDGPTFPYFDTLFPHLERGNAEVAAAFGRHVHWGYWAEPGRATGDAADFAAAAEALTVEVYDAGRVRDNQSVLDVGCGLGGTLTSLNERFRGMQLIGLNIDPRQLAVARVQATARDGNQLEFIQGTASTLPFPDASFDSVLAVEAIFHFPDRAKFFAEAHRVLKPGGRLALSDFVPAGWLLPAGWLNINAGYYGHCDMRYSLRRYRGLAANVGFRPTVERDITANTIPTYAFLTTLPRPAGNPRAGVYETIALYVLSRLRILRYSILAFEKI